MCDEQGSPRVRRRRGPYAKTRATRNAILDAALLVFAESGYRAGSLREIAERVNMSEAGLLHHFPSKSAMLLAVLDRRDDLARDVVNFDAVDGADVLRALVLLAEQNAAAPGVVELYATLSAEATSADHPAHDYFRQRYVITRTEIGRAFANLRRDEKLRPGVDPAQAAITTIALMDGLQVQWLLDRSVVDMAQELRVLFAALVDDEF